MRHTSENGVKRHIISMRISEQEWDSLHEAMKYLQCRRVSDLMREAFKMVVTPAANFEATTEGHNTAG